jgi:hypothetical protein
LGSHGHAGGTWGFDDEAAGQSPSADRFSENGSQQETVNTADSFPVDSSLLTVNRDRHDGQTPVDSACVRCGKFSTQHNDGRVLHDICYRMYQREATA